MVARFLAALTAATALAALSGSAAARVERVAYAGPLGIYLLPDGSRLWTGPMVDENGPTLQYVFADGREGRAKPAANATFADAGDCAVTIAADASRRTLRVRDCRGDRLARSVTAPREQDLSFTASDGRRIGASYWSLPGMARPAIVLCHGADYETRQMGATIAMLLDAGLNVVAFDQRGSGDSEGDWQPDGIVQIGADAAQAARLLRARGLATRVGFYGFSNGGWVAPAAAAQLGSPTFVIIKSGDAQTVIANIIYETRVAVGAKFGPAAGLKAAEAMRVVLAAVEGDTPALWARAAATLKTIEPAPWRAMTPLPPAAALPLPPAMLAGYRRQVVHDPSRDLARIAGPVLVLLGQNDKDVEASASAARYRAIFAAAGKRDATIRVFPGAGHQLALGPSAAADSSLVAGRFAPGFPRTMFDWIRREVLRAPARRTRSR